MINGLTLTKEKITLCESRRVTENEQSVEYSLYSITTRNGKVYYALEIYDGKSSELEVLGDDPDSSKKIYLNIVEGRVSSVSFGDIIHDVKMSKKY